MLPTEIQLAEFSYNVNIQRITLAMRCAFAVANSQTQKDVTNYRSRASGHTLHAREIQILYGRKVIVWNDHRPLAYLKTLSQHSSRLAKYNLQLQGYNIKTRYIPIQNQLADHHTRL